MKSKLNYYFTLAIIGLFYSNTQAQNTPYIDPIYSNISTSTVNYSDVYEDAFHKMDIYQPQGDTHSKRPLLIYIYTVEPSMPAIKPLPIAWISVPTSPKRVT